jgi:hypothetical protein
LLLLVGFPLILGLSAATYQRASGLGTDAYLWRWLAVTGAMFTNFRGQLRDRAPPIHHDMKRAQRVATHRRHTDRPQAGTLRPPQTFLANS